jgi:omega-amidase
MNTTEPKPKSLRVALCQLPVVADKSTNIATAQAAIASAASNGAELVVLPEVWNSTYLASAFPKNAEPVPGGPSSEALAQAARDGRVWLIGGSVPESDEHGNVYNTCAVFNPAGDLVAKYRKAHLFDIDIPGKIAFRESDTLTGGGAVTVVDTPWGRIGIGICYDLRFPELSLVMRRRGADILVFPGAFNCATGPPHWELLQRARALDTQCFVLTASPSRAVEDPAAYQAYGHSSVVDPWGTVLATTEHAPATVWATLDLERIAEVRRNIPVSTQTRGDLYEVVDMGPPEL